MMFMSAPLENVITRFALPNGRYAVITLPYAASAHGLFIELMGADNRTRHDTFYAFDTAEMIDTVNALYKSNASAVYRSPCDTYLCHVCAGYHEANCLVDMGHDEVRKDCLTTKETLTAGTYQCNDCLQFVSVEG